MNHQRTLARYALPFVVLCLVAGCPTDDRRRARVDAGPTRDATVGGADTNAGCSCDGRMCGVNECGETCGLGCGEGLCEDGICVSGCAPGTSQCGEACVDLDSSALHCGSCNMACSSSIGGVAMCMDARCVEVCSAETEACTSGACVEGHCCPSGSCFDGEACIAAGPSCSPDGAEVITCAAGTLDSRACGELTCQDDGETVDCIGGATSCTNTCTYASDGDCDDGGPGSDYSLCTLGTDCDDCGAR